MKLGISLKIDVTKIDKARLFAGEKGMYLDITTFIDTDNLDQYGNNGFITQATTKEERDAGTKLPILGNTKIYYNEQQKQAQPQGMQQAQNQFQQAPPQQQAPQQNFQQQAPQQAPPAQNNFDDDIPF